MPTSELLPTLTATAALLLATMLGLWIVSLRLRNASIADVFWGLGFVLVAATATWINRPASPRQLLLLALTTIWGLRLATHLFIRSRGKPEDRRYAAMRKHHGPRFWWVSLFTVFLLQGALLWFVSLPVQATTIADGAQDWRWLDVAGVALWLVGFVFESVGDRQLARFRAEPENRGRVFDGGLWRYTRHPNYFGDFCVWWGLYLIAAAGGGGWTVGSPLLMSWLLMKVSGVGLLERTIGVERSDYADYQARTNAFFPGPPTNRIAYDRSSR